MGFRTIIKIISSFLFAFCNHQEKSIQNSGTEDINVGTENTVAAGNSTTSDSALLSQTYSNEKFGFTIRYPAAWQVQAHPGQHGRSFVLNILPSYREIAAKTPLLVNSDAAYSYVAVIPEGLGTELPSGDMKTFSEANFSHKLLFPVSKEDSRVFYLQNGEPWAYFILPAAAPPSWQNGFVFVQAGVENFQTDCFDKATGERKEPNHCDPLTGDKVVQRGTIKKGEADTIRQIISSLRFDKTGAGSFSKQGIRINQPVENSTVSSPLNVIGEARGNWFFESTFSVVLYNASGKPLARGVAKAEGDWMTEDFVPFRATLKFEAQEVEKGRLVFKKANPSGLKKNAHSIAVPVLLQPK